jgi:hypothetical protein
VAVYLVRRNPEIDIVSVQQNAARLQSHIVGYEEVSMDLSDDQIHRIVKVIREKYGPAAARFARREVMRYGGLDETKRDSWLRVLDRLRETK